MVSVDGQVSWWDVFEVVDYTSFARQQVVMLSEARRIAVNKRCEEIFKAVLELSQDREKAEEAYKDVEGFSLLYPFIMGAIAILRFSFKDGLAIVVRMNDDGPCAIEVIDVLEE